MVNASKKDLETCQWGLAAHGSADLKRASLTKNAKAPRKSQGPHVCYITAALVVTSP
jgi:hypothetical protein